VEVSPCRRIQHGKCRLFNAFYRHLSGHYVLDEFAVSSPSRYPVASAWIRRTMLHRAWFTNLPPVFNSHCCKLVSDELVSQHLIDSGRGKNTQLSLAGPVRQAQLSPWRSSNSKEHMEKNG